jgi:curved DNA-binding protein CbpA
MSLKLDRGLFKYDVLDYHAFLCVPISAEIKEIRKRYLKIARRLHPDSCISASDVEKELANQLLSKMVNPAYEKLSAERNRAEYLLILSQIGKRLLPEAASVELYFDLSKQLAKSPGIDLAYLHAIHQLAETQFSDLEKVPQVIAQVSELNLVYLLRVAAQSNNPPTPRPAQIAAKPATTPEPPKEDSLTENYIRRAQTLMDKNQFAQAKIELQDALKLQPRNSRCHSLMGTVYLKLNQLKMAKVHLDNALKLDPKDALALEWKPKVDKALGTSGTTQTTSRVNQGNGSSEKSGGLFGGLFGGKKK